MARDRLTPVRQLAERMVRDYRDGYCSCHRRVETCGWHRLSQCDAGDAHDRAYHAVVAASESINPRHRDDIDSGYLHAAAERFARRGGR